MKSDSLITLSKIHKLYRDGERLVVLSLYDAVMARIADDCGVHIILVGDSMGMNILGYKTTVPVTLEQSLHHTAAVARGTRNALVIGDMPFLTFQISPEQSLRNAGRYLQEAGADGVKLEGGVHIAPTAKRLVDAGIPVLGHIGLLPQKIFTDGPYRIRGRSRSEADGLLTDAKALQEAGVFAIILECIPVSLAREITESLSVPTIGIGAGVHCSGQVQVAHDILGMNIDFTPRHSKQYAQLGKEMAKVFLRYKDEVQTQKFPTEKQSSH